MSQAFPAGEMLAFDMTLFLASTVKAQMLAYLDIPRAVRKLTAHNKALEGDP